MTKTKSRKQKVKPYITLNKSDIRQIQILFWEQDKSMMDIAKIYGVARFRIKQLLEDHPYEP